MSGTARGTIDCQTNEANEFRNTSNAFKVWFDAFEAHPNTTRVALQYGLGGTGTDFWDGGNPFGRSAFAVWSMAATGVRAYPYTFIMQIAGSTTNNTTYGDAPGDPGTHTGSTSSSWGSLTLAVAIGVGGDEDPWNGTTVNDGTDSKGGSAAYAAGNDGNGTVWRVPAAGGTDLLAFPRTNSIDGSNEATGRGSMIVFNPSNVGVCRYHLVMDDDNIYAYSDVGDNGGGQFCIIGPYEPRPDATITYPFVAYTEGAGSMSFGAVPEGDGGVALPDSLFSTIPVGGFNMDPNNFMATGTQPNNLFTPSQYDIGPLAFRVIGKDRVFMDGLLGTVGSADGFTLWSYNIPWRSTSGSLTRAYLGDAATASWKISVPWDGVTVPGTTVTRTGISF
jgi:hypothetical protein